ncbi:remorin isoform X1 [Zea mays]|uniref:Remorin C-terminal domain-containing protein n=1 Tax=Zea mays TaxID=4577 RepID=A0A804PKN6_MAIZE|nr:remorin isoform X1 [Zea mays]|eukprot:XP_020408996.1 remorin isoform X2 [Zea mays]
MAAVVEAAPAAETAAKAVAEEEAGVTAPGPPVGGSNSKALIVVDKVDDKPFSLNNMPRNSNDRVEIEKINSLIKAWEENEKAKADNKTAKKQSIILSWENTKKAIIEAELKKKKEELEKKMAEYAEKMKNKKAIIHKKAEEKRAMVMAQHGEEILKTEEMAAKYRATRVAPKKFLRCFRA